MESPVGDEEGLVLCSVRHILVLNGWTGWLAVTLKTTYILTGKYQRLAGATDANLKDGLSLYQIFDLTCEIAAVFLASKPTW